VTDLDHIDDKLAKKIAGTVRLLASDRPGEAVAAIQAFGRILQGAGVDVVHCIAKRIEHPGDTLNDAEMKAIFDAGVAEGLKQAKRQMRVNGAYPSSHDMALYCRQRNHQLREKEQRFVNDMAARSLQRALTPRQEEWLKAIFLRLGGEV
jgi:hypothetical protein